MTIQISVSNRQKMGYLVELLKSMDFVERVQVDEETQPETAALATANDSLPAENKPSLSARFYGSLRSGLTIDEIDHQLRTLRNEWDRPTW